MRKLKCSGHRPACGRCAREENECVYSLRKTMGRPRKRRREGEDEGEGDVEIGGEGEAEVEAGALELRGASAPDSGRLDGGFEFGGVFLPEFGEGRRYAQGQVDLGLRGCNGPSPPMTSFE
ncbi:uncharacterized protein EKO05_0001511 [Ascochyta rabiei]|uniref:uncharacterized protein n=1 Tax=Didymella rabiei TaxID=5454 RepID=UPI00220823A3|nr:uncharacterized protein EKO05_0001511 [Ascochyta rabiei]UPX10875.1 hypothetical protein EKO05_0001511 [Ascochyta rabiei]